MVICVLISLLMGGAVFLLVYSIYPLIVDYSNRRIEKRLKELLPAIESRKDRDFIRFITTISPVLSVVILILLLAFARSALSVVVSFVAAYFAYRGPYLLKERIKASQDEKFIEQLPGILNAIANSVKAGESLPVAFKVVAASYDPPIGIVFRHISSRYSAGEKFDEAMLKVAGILKIEAFDYLARAISIHVRRGGPAFEMINEIRTSIIEQDRCNRVIKATTAAGRYTIKFLTYSPVFFIPMLSFLQPDWADLLLGNFIGVVLSVLAVGLYLFALRWAKNILAIEKI